MATSLESEEMFHFSVVFIGCFLSLFLVTEINCDVICSDTGLQNQTGLSDSLNATGCITTTDISPLIVEDDNFPPVPRRFFEIDQTVATIIAISVTMTAVVITIIIIVCCFWSKCPLYSACRVQYTSDLPTLEKGEDVNIKAMPTDDTDSQRTLVLSNNGKSTDRSDNPVVAV